MSGLCGWIDSGMETGQAESVLIKMLASVNGNDLNADKSILVNTGAMATWPGIVPISMHQAGALVVAVQGRVDWHLPDLTTIAAERGCAAALAEAYRQHGSNCLRHMGGPCAVAIVDADSASGLLAVDRMGIRTMCYANP